MNGSYFLLCLIVRTIIVGAGSAVRHFLVVVVVVVGNCRLEEVPLLPVVVAFSNS